MDPIFLLTGLLTVAVAVAGLILASYLERRAMTARRRGGGAARPKGLGTDGAPS